jgi:ethanolamine utilization protein EutN
MHFARVIGTVVCTEKVPAFRSHRLLLIEPVDAEARHPGRPLVAVDLVSAAPGQHVFYVRGREAANALPDPDNPADAAIVGIVDDVRQRPLGAPEPAREGGPPPARPKA